MRAGTAESSTYLSLILLSSLPSPMRDSEIDGAGRRAEREENG